MLSRVVLTSFLLGSLALFQYRYHIYEVGTGPLLFFAAAVYAISGAYWYLLKTTGRPVFFASLQVFGDIALVTWLVGLTGGIDSSFSLLYHISIISSSILLSSRMVYFTASFASILYGGLLDVQYYGALGFLRSQTYTAGQVLFLLFVNIVSFYLVAFLSGYLAERLRRTRQELQAKRIDFEDLRVLQDLILRSVGSGIVTINMAGRITSWNNAAEVITGYDVEAIRERWTSVFGDGIKGLFGHTDDLRSGPIRFQGTITKPDGAAAVLEFTASLLRDDQDVVRGIILIFQDITQFREMEDKVRRQERLASVGSLAAGIAHEIRNPLASLNGSIELLREELVLSEEHRNLMDIVLRETERLNTIITEFLDYARPTAGSAVPVPLAPLVQETVLLFKNSRDYRASIEIRCAVGDDIVVSGDPARLRQVLWNLLINAAQAIVGSGAITVGADPMPDDADRVAITVSDTGAGMTADQAKMIFDPFYTTKTNGTGLGLAIVYRIVEDHRGVIDVASEPGKGTTFTVKLPIAPEAPERGGARSYRNERTAAGAPGP